MTPRDDERRKFEAAARQVFGIPSDVSFEIWKDGRYVGTTTQKAYEIWMLARAEQAETPRTREELEKEWLAQTEWQDFTNWLIHVKLWYVSVENCPSPSCTVCGAAMQPKVEFKCLSCGSTPAPTEPVRESKFRRGLSGHFADHLSTHIGPPNECPVCIKIETQTAAAPVEDRPAPTPTARQKVYAFMQLPTHVKLERLRDLAWELAAIPGRPKSAKPTLPIETICAKWTDDCQGKKDYDGRIVSISTRYWPSGGGFHILPADHQDFSLSTDPAIRPSAAASIHLNFGEPDEYGYGDYRELARAEFEADTEQEVKQKVEAWAAAQFKRIGSLLEGKL